MSLPSFVQALLGQSLSGLTLQSLAPFGRRSRLLAPFGEFQAAPESAAPDFAAVPSVTKLWSSARLRLTDALWGDGYQMPGGEPELLRLAKPLGLSDASSVLMIGVGSGGAPVSVAANLGAWITGFETDPDLAEAARSRAAMSKAKRRIKIESWNPAAPAFPEKYFNHCIALEPLGGHAAEPILAALADALKSGGQLMMTGFVIGEDAAAADPGILRWEQLEQRHCDTPRHEVTITRVLGRLGFDVRVVEDVSGRHLHQAVIGWRRLLRGMEHERPAPPEAAQLVREAEMWLTRHRLMRDGRLRLMRWHALGRGTH